jgi:hypothetical protein
MKTYGGVDVQFHAFLTAALMAIQSETYAAQENVISVGF